MWLSNSSIGRKVVMSITGLFLVLFLTFHMCMNLVALISPAGYNAVCQFLGANWYALAGTVILAAGAVLHIVYAFWLTLQNRKARGNDRYLVNTRPQTVEWASQNMLVLGIIVLLGLVLHLFNFWYKMQLNEIVGHLPEVNPHDGIALIRETFGCQLFISFGSLLCGSISLMDFGVPCKPSVSTTTYGSTVGNVSPTFSQQSSAWALPPLPSLSM